MARFFFDLEDLDRNSGLTIDDASLIISPFTLTSSADYNGDGIDDLVVAPAAESATQIEIIYGSDELPASLELAEVKDSTRLIGSADNLIDLVLLASNLDFNGDEIDDLLYISVEGEEFEDVGFASRLIFGSEDAAATIDLEDLDGADGLEFVGDSPAVFAQGIDVNDDGSDDLVFTVEDLTATEPSFANFVFLGGERDFNSTLNPTAVNGRNGFEIDTNGISLLVGVAKDINDDGFNDLTIDSFESGSAENASRILFGSETFPATVDSSDIDDDEGLEIIASDAGADDAIGSFLLDDLNGDGIADILVSQATIEASDPDAETDPNEFLNSLNTPGNLENVSGQRIFAVFGSETFDATVDLSNLDGDDGFAIVNSDSDELNIVSTTSLDLNNDELEDLVINDLASDRTYVVFGQSEFEAEVDLADLDGDDGFVLAEAASFDYTNSYTGDLNGDDLDDLILETDGDRTYVVYGTEEEFEAEFDPTAFTNTLVIFAQSEDLRIQNIIDLNGDGADDLVYAPPFSLSSLVESDTATDFPNIQVVYGDADLGIAD